MTSIKCGHLQVMGTITGKFHQNPLKTVGGVAETRLLDGRTIGRTDEPITIVPFDLRRGTINTDLNIESKSYQKIRSHPSIHPSILLAVSEDFMCVLSFVFVLVGPYLLFRIVL